MKIALVTGATRGIGFSMARKLLDKGLQVIITGRDEIQAVEIAKKLHPNRCIGLPLDFTKERTIVEGMINQIAQESPQIIIHNAGLLATEKTPSLSKLEKMFWTNSIGPIYLHRPTFKMGNFS
jgi:NAD(P)-dependent dehydrogenase (short-subunit alcohol dehydrogenase family)